VPLSWGLALLLLVLSWEMLTSMTVVQTCVLPLAGPLKDKKLATGNG
jgi:hypothetical protein